ncbi:hypothetical protein [Pseudoduganella lutea]|uniref:Uncharacterized protein n=1 Tax=Pseudoduganella lutea TaxID=321985 RepID=A0A4P6L3F4_9BURK|nr:hypothetical protein [Pseudoduganella lutea]QBE65944.1 hypothetical protein EWM63_25600 [Pseudoduganella lutea]
MKKLIYASTLCMLAKCCFALGAPVVGLLEQYPVMADGMNVTARPTYIFTNQKLDAPTVFSGLVGVSNRLSVLCCFEVTNIKPIDMKTEFSKYASDEDFTDHLKKVAGHSHVYVASPLSDKKKWSPLMQTVVKIADNPADGSPFSAAVVQGTFEKASTPATFTMAGNKVSLRTRIDKRDNVRYSFEIGNKVYTFKEPLGPH